MKKYSFLLIPLVALLLSLILVAPAYAITFKTSEKNLTIAEDETITDDLYASGESVDIKGEVDGDVLAGGGSVTIDGKISGDLTAAAGIITLNGTVKDDVRIAGGTLYVNGTVGGDIVAAGGQVVVSQNSKIKRDALFGCGNLIVDGSIGRNLWVGAGSVELDGKVGGNVKVSSDNTVLGSNTEIDGNLIYTSSNKADIDSAAQIEGKVTHKLPPEEKREAQPLAGLAGMFFFLLFAFISFLASLITAFVLLALFPRAATETSQALVERTWASLGVGFLALIITPIAAIILMITLIGLPLGIISVVLYFVFIYLSQIVFAIFLGEKILIAISKKEKASPYLSVLIGLIILAVIGLIPFLGWFVKFVVMLFGLGALVLAMFRLIQKGREPIAAPSPTQTEVEKSG